MLDALLLYDEVVVLDAQLPHDAEQLTLRRVLFDRRILRSVDTRALAMPVSNELTEFLLDAQDASRQPVGPGYASAEDVGRSVRRLLDHYRPDGDPQSDDLQHELSGEVEGDLAHWWVSERVGALQLDPFRTLGSETLHYIGYWGSGAIHEGVSHLRTFIYWRTSAHLRIPFLPSLFRLPVYHMMTDHIRRTVQDRVYEAVADCFRTTIGEVYADEEALPLYLPPALALFLEHLRTHRNIAAAVDDLRYRYRKLRRTLGALQQSLDVSSTLGEARDARRRLDEALQTLKSELGQDSSTAAGTVDQLIDIVPGVANAVANPLDVGGYAEALLAHPADWIRSWWLRRPVRSALKLSARLEDLSQYDLLLEQATGQRCDRQQLADLRQWYGHALDMYGGDSRLPAVPPRPTTARPTEEPA